MKKLKHIKSINDLSADDSQVKEYFSYDVPGLPGPESGNKKYRYIHGIEPNEVREMMNLVSEIDDIINNYRGKEEKSVNAFIKVFKKYLNKREGFSSFIEKLK